MHVCDGTRGTYVCYVPVLYPMLYLACLAFLVSPRGVCTYVWLGVHHHQVRDNNSSSGHLHPLPRASRRPFTSLCLFDMKIDKELHTQVISGPSPYITNVFRPYPHGLWRQVGCINCLNPLCFPLAEGVVLCRESIGGNRVTG